MKYIFVLEQYDDIVTKDDNIVTKNDNIVTKDDNIVTKDDNIVTKDDNIVTKHFIFCFCYRTLWMYIIGMIACKCRIKIIRYSQSFRM